MYAYGKRDGMKDKLLKKINEGSARVAVIGMGYVGLPLAREFVKAKFNVLGVDIDPKKVKCLNAGKSYIQSVDAPTIKSWRKAKLFEATTDPKKLRKADVIIICVPTPLTSTREPDLSYVLNTTRTIAANLSPNTLVVLESTTYPGTTHEELRPILESTGMKCGKDFFLAFSPEREDPGSKTHTTGTIPKVVGGEDPASGELAAALYSKVVIRVVPVSGTREAEAAKILENVYRAVNIAMVNELKILFDRMGIDVHEVIAAAATKPFGYQPFWPGPGLGGHCIPIDPFYLTWKARHYEMPTHFIELAGVINTSMPDYVVTKTMEALNMQRKPIKGSKVLILGVAYKKDVDDERESPAFKIIDLLQGHGAKLSYHDPFIPSVGPLRAWPKLKMKSVPLTKARVAASDCVLIVTDHSCIDYKWLVKTAKLVVDTRNATKDVRAGRSKIVKA